MIQIDKVWLFETSVMEPYFFGKIDGVVCDLKDERTIELINIDYCEYKLTEVCKSSIKWTANFGGEDNGILRTLGKQEYTYELSFNLPLYNGRIIDDMAGRQFSVLCEGRNGQRFVLFAQFEAKDIDVENEQQTRVVLSSARTSAKRFNVLSANIVDVGITIDCDEVFSSLNEQNQMYFDFFPTTNIPSDFMVIESGLEYLTWSWSISLGAKGYEFAWGADPNSLNNIVEISGGSTNSYRLEGLAQNTTYYAKIKALGDYSHSLYTSVSQGTTEFNLITLDPPSNLVLENITDSSITISCTSNSSGLESGFEWRISDDENFSNILETNTTPSGQANPINTFEGLDGSTNYFVSVRANGVVDSEWSETLEVQTSTQAMIIEVDTTISGATPSDSFELRVDSSLSGTSYDVDWGDGNTDHNQTGNITHVYASGGVYEIQITGFYSVRYNNTGDKNKLVELKSWGENITVTGMFNGCANLDITATDIPIIGNNFGFGLNAAFNGCVSINSIPNIGLWDVSSIDDLQNAFRGLLLVSDYENIDNWDWSVITNMNSSFRGNISMNEPAFSNIDISNVTTLNSTFFNCQSFDQDLSGWSYRNVNDYAGFISGSGMSIANYDALLIAWDADKANLAVSKTIGVQGLEYTTGGAAEAARNNLILSNSWTFDGDIGV